MEMVVCFMVIESNYAFDVGTEWERSLVCIRSEALKKRVKWNNDCLVIARDNRHRNLHIFGTAREIQSTPTFVTEKNVIKN